MIESVIEKYNYPDDLANFLRDLYPWLIEYFGEDKKDIIDAMFLDTPIFTNTNSYEIVKKYGDLENLGIVKEDDFKRASGVCSFDVDVIWENGEYKIDKYKRVVSVSGDISEERVKSDLIHEICHAIKTYYNGFVICGDILIERDGLVIRRSKLINDTDRVRKVFLEEHNVAFEEGLNSLAEEWLAKKVIAPDYEVKGYGLITQMARNVVRGLDCLQELVNAQIYKTDVDFIPEYEKLMAISDLIYQKNLKLFESIFDKEKFNEVNTELQSIIINDYNPLIKEIITSKVER